MGEYLMNILNSTIDGKMKISTHDHCCKEAHKNIEILKAANLISPIEYAAIYEHLALQQDGNKGAAARLAIQLPPIF